MSVFAVPRTWSLAQRAPAPSGACWVPVEHDGALQWRLGRNCALTPGQMASVFGSLGLVSLSIGGFFAWQGAPWVVAFAGLELLALALALWVFARHAGDGEHLVLQGDAMHVAQHHGARTTHTEFPLAWLSVEPAGAQGSLIELRGHGRRVQVGRFLRPEQRPLLAAELRRALRRAQAGPGPEQDLN